MKSKLSQRVDKALSVAMPGRMDKQVRNGSARWPTGNDQLATF